MTKVTNRYTVLRRYENKYGIDEMMKRIIRIHLRTVEPNQENKKEYSDHGGKEDGKQ